MVVGEETTVPVSPDVVEDTVTETKVSVGAFTVMQQVTWPLTAPKGKAVIIGTIITTATQARLVVRR